MYRRLIPSLLLHKGRLVKGRRFGTYKDAGAPATTARAHNAQGADELLVCDIDASKNGTHPDFDTLAKIADECFMPLTVFGAINSVERAEKCMATGADKIGLTTTALDNPALISELAMLYGAQAVVLGLDVIKDDNGVYRLFDYRTGLTTLEKSDPFTWAIEAVDRGCGEIRLMAVDREGTQSGFDLNLYSRLSKVVNVPIILEGGGGSLEHIQQAYESGVGAVSLGAMLVFSDANLVKIQQHMRSNGINMRA